jgi:hypothetical protein
MKARPSVRSILIFLPILLMNLASIVCPVLFFYVRYSSSAKRGVAEAKSILAHKKKGKFQDRVG